jgi:hypothetical protein
MFASLSPKAVTCLYKKYDDLFTLNNAYFKEFLHFEGLI